MRRAAERRAGGAGWRVAPRAGRTLAQRGWLTRGGSLTAHLARLGRVSVRVTRETVALPWPDEAAALGLAPRAPVWAREVVLEVGGVPFVAAHSVAPLATSRGVWQAMRRLRTRPLAELLYSDAQVSRSALTSRRIGPRHPLHDLARQAAEAHGADVAAATDTPAPRGDLFQTYVARRSVFLRHGAPLMVTECFLPALWRELERRRAAAQDTPS